MTNIKELVNEMSTFKNEMEKMLEITKYREYEDMSAVKYNNMNPDDMLIMEEYKKILYNISEMDYILEYLNRPVRFEDILILRTDGRYGTSNDSVYYTSGSSIEFLYNENVVNDEGEFDCVPVWKISTVEHNGKEYYIVGYPDIRLDNLKVRIRG